MARCVLVACLVLCCGTCSQPLTLNPSSSVILEGWAASGKGALMKKVVKYMDPRGFQVHPMGSANPEERSYPFLWRFWQKMPPKGNINILYHGWYTRVLQQS